MKNLSYLFSRKLAVGLTLSLLVSTSISHAQSTLQFYNWSDYIGENTVEKFEKETGIKVVSDYFDSNEILEAKLLTGRSGFDLVVPSFTFMARQIKAGVFQSLDKSKLPNLKNIDPELLQSLTKLDPGNAYGLPYLWGTTGIGYNVDQVKAVLGEDAPVNSWDLIFKKENIEKLQSCGVAFLDTADEIYPAALIYTGKNANSKDSADYNASSEAYSLLKEIRPYVGSFNSSQYISDLASGDICVAIGYSGDIFQAQYRAEESGKGVQIEYSIPQEGASMWFDMLAIPKDASNPDAAHQFINFLMRPEIIAEITDYVAYANPNLAATSMIDEGISGNPSIYPQDHVKSRLITQELRSDKLNKKLNRLWTNLKAGR